MIGTVVQEGWPTFVDKYTHTAKEACPYAVLSCYVDYDKMNVKVYILLVCENGLLGDTIPSGLVDEKTADVAYGSATAHSILNFYSPKRREAKETKKL